MFIFRKFITNHLIFFLKQKTFKNTIFKKNVKNFCRLNIIENRRISPHHNFYKLFFLVNFTTFFSIFFNVRISQRVNNNIVNVIKSRVGTIIFCFNFFLCNKLFLIVLFFIQNLSNRNVFIIININSKCTSILKTP